MTDISIVIASYNTRDLLLQCLASIEASEGAGEVEVFVVDNDSRDGTVDALREHFPDVRLVLNPRNLGFAAANNRALRLCGGRYVLLLNPDTKLDPGTLREVRAVMDARPDVGMAGIKLVRQDGSLDRACRRGFPTLMNSAARFLGLDRVFPRSRLFGGYNLTWRDPDGDYEVDSIVGAFMFLRREVVEEVGLLDESFFMYGEDLDWCWRVRASRWKVLYLGSQEALHIKGASTRRNPAEMNRHFHEAMAIFHRKHLEDRYPFFVNWAVQAGIAARWGAKALALKVRKGERAPS
ncbi:MAG: glycosyltransferase family 2 protein [Planctomycetota bacterium]